jgi:gluconate kinase
LLRHISNLRNKGYTVIIFKKHKKLVIAQTFIKEKYRVDLLKKIPKVSFVLVKTNKFVREKRLIDRTDYPLDLEYSRKMVKNFEKPEVKYKIIINDQEGKEVIIKQIQQLRGLSLS